MRKINRDKAQILTGTADSFESLMLNVKELGGATLATGGACCKTNTEHYFCFSPFLVKQKSSSDFLWLAKTGINVGLSLKCSGLKRSFEKWGNTVGRKRNLFFLFT